LAGEPFPDGFPNNALSDDFADAEKCSFYVRTVMLFDCVVG
jgi:hypothetical protein